MQKRLFSKSSLAGAVALLVAQLTASAQTFTPIPLTPGSFNAAVVIPSNWTYSLNAQSVSVTIDSGPTLQTNTVTGFPPYYSIDSGDTFFEIGMERTSATTLNYGLPHGGTLLTNTLTVGLTNAHIYQLPYWTNWNSNCICIGPYTNGNLYNGIPLTGGPYTGRSYYTNVNLTLNTTTNYTALSLLTTGGGPDPENVTISYADGSTQFVNFVIPNWFVNSNFYAYPTAPLAGNVPVAAFAYTANSRCNPAENQNVFTASSGVSSGSRLWSIDIALSDTNSYPTNLSFSTYVTNNGGHVSVIVAVSGGTNPADVAMVPNTNFLVGPFNPIAVSGYNAGFVVPNNALTLAGSAPLTGTMDNGTNLAAGANTWFEVGWDRAAPTNGFPAHGSILTSFANPTRTYQMPANYNQPMCTLVDTNHQVVNITPQNPASYSAFSLLTCGASIGATSTMTNYIILQHSDGVNESNLFFGYDWFNTTLPYAYAAYERVNIGTATGTAGRSVQNLDTTGTSAGVPRIYESEFPMADGTAVTNIVLGFVRSPAVNAATYVIAVSATTNFLPIALGNYTPAQNVYAGNSASFSVSVTAGTLPTYQWQKTDGLTFTNNLSRGPTGTGSTLQGVATSNLTIVNAGPSDVGFYTCQVSNPAPSVVSSTFAPLTMLVSTGSNITQPGDPITDFNNPVGSPAGLGVANLIDGTLATYLNYGPDDDTTGPFSGPVGVIVTPNAGASILNALRFVAAVNASICDPADYMLEGSTDGGMTYSTIVPDTALNIPVERNLLSLYPTAPITISNMVLQEVDFSNTNIYTTYRLTINNVRSNSAANSMQVAEIQFLGSLAPIPPGILVQPAPPSADLYVGASISYTTAGNGAPPISYQWYQGATLLSGATNSTYSKTNVGVGDSGNYTCVLSNPYGSTTSSIVALTVESPSSTYVSRVLADHPIAFYPLNESPDNSSGDNGTPMLDWVGSHNGVYSNVVIGITPGYSTNDPTETTVDFGTQNTNYSFGGDVSPGLGFVAPTNSDGELSVEAWVNGASQPGLYQPIGGAGIVCLGYSGGGEQFCMDCGGTSNSWRFYFRDAAGPSFTANASSPSADGVWHHLVGVVDGANKKEYLWVDGQLAALTALPTNGLGLLAENSPTNRFSIGWRNGADTGPFAGTSFQFDGQIDDVSIYNYALTSNQVQNHYLAAGIPPRFTVVPTNETISEGTTATFSGEAYGSPTISYQWYNSDGSNPTTALAGQTGTNLVLNNVAQGQSGSYYQLVASNAYGVSNSPAAILIVVSGPPVLEEDVTTTLFALAGSPVVLSGVFTGTQPITYQWYFNSAPLGNGGTISGATSNVLTILDAQAANSGNYQLVASNSLGTNQTSMAAVTVVPILGFNGLGSGWTTQGSEATTAYVSSNVLQLTFGGGDEENSSFFSFPMYVAGFKATWDYEVVGAVGNDADGAAFVIQNDPRGASAIGAGGGSLGVGGGTPITPSVELEFNVYPPNGIGMSLDTNGAIGPNISTSPVNVDSGDIIAVTVVYLNGTATVTLEDTNTTQSFSASVNINIPSVVGSNMAYVGFSGATGGVASTQQVSDFQFIPYIGLTASLSSHNVVLSWPSGVGGYMLQQSSSLSPPVWSTVTNVPVQVGSFNEVTLAPASAKSFFQLVLP